ncbi:MAG TPA: hypothetical protein VFU23_07730 [Gemmatimonadales bacterium]|nr:hypothetical protein [Gemmatimonadales bacterium]
MSGVISFRGGDFWGVAGWAFDGYLDHVLAEVGDDPELRYIVEQAMALNGLHIERQGPRQLERLAPILLRVADEVVAGSRSVRVEGRTLDDRSQIQFRRAVEELRILLRRHLTRSTYGLQESVTLHDTRRFRVLAAIQKALLGEVTPNLRAVTVTYDDESIHFEAYFDGAIGQDERKSMSQVEAGLREQFPQAHRITHQVMRMDAPSAIPKDRIWVYYRKEPLAE